MFLFSTFIPLLTSVWKLHKPCSLYLFFTSFYPCFPKFFLSHLIIFLQKIIYTLKSRCARKSLFRQFVHVIWLLAKVDLSSYGYDGNGLAGEAEQQMKGSLWCSLELLWCLLELQITISSFIECVKQEFWIIEKVFIVILNILVKHTY